MNILITGANGQLGTELSGLLPNAILTDAKELDITNKNMVSRFVKRHNIDTIINCAAYTAVDAAEDNVIDAVKINAIGPENLAKTGCKLVQISTDYVFDGSSKTPYKTTNKPFPLSIYGYTKLLGERAVLRFSPEHVVIRTAWLYSPYGKNFVKTMQKLGAEKSEISVVNDQIGTPTYAADLAKAIVEIVPQINGKKSGGYHFTNMGQCSWYDFACEIMKKSGLKCKVNPIPTSQYKTAAPRPLYSVLDKTKIINTFEIDIPDWKDALTRCIKQISR